MAEKIPPHSLEAERSVIGACLLSRDALADVMEIVRDDDFYEGANREIFKTIVEMFRENTNVDLVTVSDALKSRKSLDMVGGRAYVASLAGEVPSASNASEYAKIVAEKASMRRLIRLSEQIRERGFDENESPRETLDYAESEIFRLAQSQQRTDYTPIKEVLVSDINLLEKAVKNQGQITGVTTGFRELDAVTNGLQKSDLIILAARPAMGKTAFALNIAQNAAIKGGATVMIFSLEMPKEQLGQRLLSMEASVEMENIKKGKLEKDDWERILTAADNLSKTNIVIDDTPGVSVFEIRNKCRRLKSERGSLDLVIIDYLQLFRSEMDNRVLEIGNWTRNLKLLARELDCPIIVLSQLSRQVDSRTPPRPMLSDLRESGSIEQDADIVIFLYREDYYNEESERPGVCEVNLAKHRSGPTRAIDLTWVARYTKFSDMA